MWHQLEEVDPFRRGSHEKRVGAPTLEQATAHAFAEARLTHDSEGNVCWKESDLEDGELEGSTRWDSDESFR